MGLFSYLISKAEHSGPATLFNHGSPKAGRKSDYFWSVSCRHYKVEAVRRDYNCLQLGRVRVTVSRSSLQILKHAHISSSDALS